MKKKRIIIEAPKCFGKKEKAEQPCINCIFLFDCLEKQAKDNERR